MDRENGGGRHRSIDVGKEIRSPFEILVDDAARERRRIDLEEHEIPPASEQPVGDTTDLAGVRTVDEPFACEALRTIFAARLGGRPF
jgi:hypothetical protein